MSIQTTATLICPNCQTSQTVEMSIDACQFFYKCEKCSEIMKPKPGDCCVFCSYANIKCPPKQKEELTNFKRG